MKITLQFGRMCLSFRGTLDLATSRTDARGLTGSELGCIRIAEELHALGHTVSLHTLAAEVGTTWNGIRVRGIDDPIETCDAVIAINEPDLLRAAPVGAFRVCQFWLNQASHCKAGFEQHVDLFCSPSAPHLRQFMTNPAWHEVEKTPEHPHGKARYTPDPAKWTVVPLGCDPERYVGHGDKIPGRCIYASSPDRGLHHVLEQWPAIRRAVPHATLHIFYRLEPWLRGWDTTPYFPPVEPLRDRALYIEECLRRFSEQPDGLGVTVRGSVSRETIEREMAVAEALLYPCDTTTWSEGFSCTTLEACAARAWPVITDCDALGEVYGGVINVCKRSTPEWPRTWGQFATNNLLLRATHGNQRNIEAAQRFAAEHTWRRTAELIVKEIETRRPT